MQTLPYGDPIKGQGRVVQSASLPVYIECRAVGVGAITLMRIVMQYSDWLMPQNYIGIGAAQRLGNV
ncbi:hypothetical protein VP1G_10883 [Cytospora mali]|uniref:Uncharacterized protein n=1 Tax=Cytospora mali TaxID=578113 RepID=A0A194UYT7_CYTMA|nr:hypothetical protein VP1G_10883 [Valsa mali var. pyri (nom. inval.)]